MNRLDESQQVQVLKCLCEGMSIRGTVRVTGVAKNTVTKLLVDMGCACAAFHDAHVRNLRVRRLQADEIWSFVGAKAKNVTKEKEQDGWGDVWTWTATRLRFISRATIFAASIRRFASHRQWKRG